MAGTSWDKLGQMDAAFEAVADTIRAAAREGGARLREFHNEDPVWRLVVGENYVDVVWDESKPEVFAIRAIRWVDDKPQYDTVGEFERAHDQSELSSLLTDALARVKA